MSHNINMDPEFTKTCSEVTLQSKKEGFFLSYADTVAELLGEKWMQESFSNLKTDEERIAICYSDPKVKEAVLNTMKHVSPLYRGKDPVIAQKKLLEGRMELKNGNNTKALVLFTQALLRAMPTDSEPSMTLPHAFAARSEALLELGKYNESIDDMKLAIQEGFPNHLRYQLFWRMARCHRNLGDVAKAHVCLQLSLKMLEDAPAKDQHSKSVILEDIKNLKEVDPSTVQLVEKKAKELPKVVGGVNSSMPGASSYLKVAHEGNKGRYCVTKSTLSAGDCVVAEHPYASVLLPEMGGTHCHHCFQRLQCAIGCPTCSGVAFCSPECRNKALSTYHQHECRYLGLMLGSGMSILSMLALRIITQESEGLKYFCKMKHHLAANLKNGERDHQLDSHAQEYLRVWNLETHEDKRTPHDLFQRTLMAIFLLRILQDGGKFFPKDENKKMENSEVGNAIGENELLIGSIMLHHLQLLQFNAHEIFETVVKTENMIRGSKTIYLGVGLYPTVSFFNHDCYPALSRHFVGSALVLHVLRPLKAGEEVPENYGPVYTKHTLAYRQRQLCCRYWFNCQCKACTGNWPDLNSMSESTPRFRKTRGKKADELNKQLATMICEVFDPALKLMEDGYPARAAKLLTEFINGVHELGVKAPHRETQLAIDALRLCLADTGNVFILRQ